MIVNIFQAGTDLIWRRERAASIPNFDRSPGQHYTICIRCVESGLVLVLRSTGHLCVAHSDTTNKNEKYFHRFFLSLVIFYYITWSLFDWWVYFNLSIIFFYIFVRALGQWVILTWQHSMDTTGTRAQVPVIDNTLDHTHTSTKHTPILYRVLCDLMRSHASIMLPRILFEVNV